MEDRYPYTWAWRLEGRKGEHCRVVKWTAPDRALVEFADGEKVRASRNAFRRRQPERAEPIVVREVRRESERRGFRFPYRKDDS
jgi:hypothetical protein